MSDRRAIMDRVAAGILAPLLKDRDQGKLTPEQFERSAMRLAPQIKEACAQALKPQATARCCQCPTAATTVKAGFAYCDAHAASVPRPKLPAGMVPNAA